MVPEIAPRAEALTGLPLSKNKVKEAPLAAKPDGVPTRQPAANSKSGQGLSSREQRTPRPIRSADR